MNRSLVARLTTIGQITAIAVVVVFALSSLWLTWQALRAQQTAFLAETVSTLASSFDDELSENPDTTQAIRNVLEEAHAAGIRVAVVDASGRPIESSTANGRSRSRLLQHELDRSLLRAMGTSKSGVRFVVTMRGRLMRSSLSALAWSLGISALPILAVSLLVSRAVTRRALRPLSAMGERAEGAAVEDGLRSLGGPTGLEEIDRLGGAFGRLLERLDDALRAERRLTADVSHELRTPLTVLSGELEMAAAQAPKPSPLADDLRRATEQVAAMRELVEAILLLHRTGANRRDASGFEPVNLCDVAREVVAEAKERSPGRTDDFDLAVPDEVLVAGQPTLLASALRNLVDNAAKFTSPGDRIRVGVEQSGLEARVIVDDEGPGVGEDERERVFDPFYRGAEARAERTGFGLGLPILRRVARAHGGDVVVDRSPLGGARFELRLPRWSAAMRPAEA